MPGVAPDFDNPGHIADMAAAVFALIFDRRAWIERRTDRLNFLNERSAHWTVSFELVIPDLGRLTGFAYGLSHIPLPIGLPRKDILDGFGMKDETGTDLSYLTPSQDRPLTSEMLLAVAEALLGHPPSPDLSLAITALARDSDSALAGVDTMRSMADGILLLGFSEFATLIHDFATHFPLITLVPYQIGARHLLTLSYDDGEDVNAAKESRSLRSRLSNVGAALTLRSRGSVNDSLVQLAVGSARSYQAEILAPPGLIFDSSLEVVLGNDDGEGEFNTTNRGDVLCVWAEQKGRGVTATCPQAFRVAPHGFGRTALSITLMTSTLFAIALAIRLGTGVHPSTSAASAVLIAIPAAYALLLIRPGEHGLTTVWTAGPRAAIIISAALAGVGAASLAIQWSTTEVIPYFELGVRSIIWMALFVVSVYLSIVALLRDWW